ncbi:hypothetical protein ACYVMA_003945 [Vibrio parahaemolyticus]|uniref:Type VI secretion system amidase effector protein Tae4 n=1 Tax=Vibrio parahaemolyticus TaxID=670 RepID=A0AA46Z4H0_VIBPH|nr:hypothetical protein [Vibrio parahaemolyticus]EXJ40295.1 hypothetical protein D047_4981 [Vibrio parahaemolyticus VPTS-2010_2]MCC3850099.1 hypothetical protein [Vibrio parahaemolyticus]UYV25149.1 type VI secretion system amidase effector protein Tae4 [Vibrio parahaemolyticus]HCJ4876734.1 hypothetical protein [Vibrio parahaemolyticus]
MAARPSLLKMKVAFAKVNRDVSDVGTIIGGKVNHNINVLTPEQGRFENPNANKLADYKDILVVDVDSWLDASGHASIWTGSRCTDSCYFPQAKKAYLWKLED